MYTKAMFGEELKQHVWRKEPVTKIGIWSHSTYMKHILDLEPGLSEIMLDLTTLELGPEFEISYAMLNKIADDLIAGKDIDLNALEYREGNVNNI